MRLFLAQSEADFEAVYSLRYRAYRSIEAIAPNAEEQFRDAFDERGRSFVFGLRFEKAVLGSMRVLICENGGRGLTAYQAFSGEIQRMFCPTDRVLEANRFVVDPSFEAAFGSVRHPLLLFRGLIYACLAYDVKHYIGATRKNHMAFYKRVVYMRAISEPQTYPGLSTRMTLLSGAFVENYRKVCERWSSDLLVEPEELEMWRDRFGATERVQSAATEK